MIEPGESETAAPETATPETASAQPRTRDQGGSLAGRELNGRIILVEKIASGTRGDVYRADDRFGFDGNLPGRRLAVKVLHETVAQAPSGLHRFKRSFHVAQALAHPNVLSVFDVHCDAGTGLHYMTMELLTGTSLRSILDELGARPVPRSEALRIIRGICMGLMHMHSKGYVHCDVRPANVFVTRRLDAVLTNFEQTVHRATAAESAFAAAPPPEDERGRVGPHARAGYESPQLMAGESPHNNDDVYSVACVSYELLSGRPPSVPPVPIRGLSRRYWKALKKALDPDRMKRTPGVTAFARDMAVLTPRAPHRKTLLWTLAGANIAVLSGFALLSMRTPSPEDTGSLVVDSVKAPAESSFSLDAVNYRVSEQSTAVRIKVVRSGNLKRPSSLAWWTRSDTALSGRDFVDLGVSTLQFDQGQAEQWIFIPIVADSAKEGSETFFVHIGEPASGDTLGAIRRASVTIDPDI